MEGNNVALFCNKSGNPGPVITWTRFGNSEVLSNTSLLTVANVRRPGNPDNLIQYQCTASNGVGNPAIAVASVTVYCKSVVLRKITRFNFAFNVVWDVVKTSYLSRIQSIKLRMEMNWWEITGKRKKIS